MPPRQPLTVGEDYSVTRRRNSVPATVLATHQVQAQTFAATLRTRVLALVSADQQAAAGIIAAAAGVQTLSFDRGESLAPERRFTVQAAGFHGMPLPEKPPKPPPNPPPGGWSSDPLMRAAQKIAYGHDVGPLDIPMDVWRQMLPHNPNDRTTQRRTLPRCQGCVET